MSPQLSSVESRILGCLIEKERTTPEVYPLSLNALINACNQSTNRFPVVSYDEKTVETGLDGLRQKKLAVLLHSSGARVAKYRHTVLDLFNLSGRELATVCVLLLRGPQTPGEIRARTERLCGSSSLAEIETSLAGLAQGADPLITALPTRPGQKETRYRELLSESATLAEESERIINSAPVSASALDRLEAEVRELRSELENLRAEFAALRDA
jgi:uncharacterized protein YceH (UPF0502 family)